MSVLCGYASINEFGKARGGKAGDQTGKEVKLGSWYYFGQNVCLRWKDEKLAKKYAEAIRHMCNNKHIGYDQNQRTSLYNELKKHDWDYADITKDVECDCSELVGCAVNCVVKRALIPSYIYTGNLVSLLMSTGLFKKLTGSKYCKESAYLKTGDILNQSGHHVISVLENGSKAGIKNDTGKVAEPTLYKGCTGSEVKKLQSNLRSCGFKLDCDGIFGADTKERLCQWQRKYKLDPDGVYGEKSFTKMKEVIK